MEINRMGSRATFSLTFGFLLSFFSGTSGSQDIEFRLQGVDVYGTDEFESSYVEREFRSELEQLSQAVATVDREAEARVSASIANSLNQLGDFAFVSVIAVPPGEFISIDVVEPQDVVNRMPFREAPSSRYEDPDGLLALWLEYVDTRSRLARARKLQGMDEPCEVIHCIAPFRPNPDLFPYLEVFNEGVRKHEDLLYEIAENDANPTRRSSAIFLLGHSTDIDRLLPLLRRAMYDPHWQVRNNAMRVRAWIWMTRPELTVPLEDFIAAMDFPTVADRNKGTMMTLQFADSVEYRTMIFQRAIPLALEMVRLKQPVNHIPAYELLKAVSGEDFGARNYSAWEEWFRTERLHVR